MQSIHYITLDSRQRWNQPLEDTSFVTVTSWKIEYSPKTFCLLDLFSAVFKYQPILDVPNISSKNTSKYNPNLCSVSWKKIIYLAIPHILSANSEQTHHILVSYLKVWKIGSGCCLLITNMIGCWQKL